MKKLLTIALLTVMPAFVGCSAESVSDLNTAEVVVPVPDIKFADLKGTWWLKDAYLNGKQVDSYFKVVFDDYKTPIAVYKTQVGTSEANDFAKVTINGNHIVLKWSDGGEVDDLEVLEFGPKSMTYRSHDNKDGVLVETYYRND